MTPEEAAVNHIESEYPLARTETNWCVSIGKGTTVIDSKDLKRRAYLHFLAGVQWARENPGWISVSERLPENGQKVISYDRFNGVDIYDVVKFDKKPGWNGWHVQNEYTPSHWMPLPLPPAPKEQP